MCSCVHSMLHENTIFSMGPGKPICTEAASSHLSRRLATSSVSLCPSAFTTTPSNTYSLHCMMQFTWYMLTHWQMPIVKTSATALCERSLCCSYTRHTIAAVSTDPDGVITGMAWLMSSGCQAEVSDERRLQLQCSLLHCCSATCMVGALQHTGLADLQCV